MGKSPAKQVVRAAVFVLAFVGSAAAQSDDPPAGLTRDDWSQIRDSIAESGYYARAVAKPGDVAAFQAPNRQQRYHTTFRRDGIEIHPEALTGASWRLGLSATGYGYEGDVRPVRTAEPQAVKERVEYRRGPVTEWYVNAPGGLEQGFDLHEPQPGRDGTLIVTMAVRGELVVSARRDGVAFDDRAGKTVIRYAGLKAWDAEGRPLHSRLDAVGREVRLVVEARGARFPITVDPTFVHEAQLFGHPDSVAEGGAKSGSAVSVSADTVVVGAPEGFDMGNVRTGAVYVFVRSGMTWVPQQKLLAADGAAGDGFGGSVSISADTVVVGARGDDTAGGVDAGSAYVFVRSGTAWSEQRKLLASDGAAGDQFGSSVSVSVDTVVVGAHLDDHPGRQDAGSAYVFVRSGTTWTQQQKILASDGAANDFFGFSVSVFADTVVVGAFRGDSPNSTDAGSAYVFVRSGTAWTEEQKLFASDGALDDYFGFSVSVSVDTVVIGAYGDDFGSNESVGSAYAFVRSGTTWSQQQKLLVSGAAFDFSGFSVSVSGNTAIVGAFAADVSHLDAGSATVFMRSGTTWAAGQTLQPFSFEGMPRDYFGWSVSIFGDTLVVGASGGDTPTVTDAGAAYVFGRGTLGWDEQRKLVGGLDGAAGDGLGSSVSASGDTVVVGASGDDRVGGADAGSAYVFVRSGTTWTEQQKLLASDGAANDLFGLSVAVSGDTIVVGAPLDDNAGGTDAGAAYVFVRSGTTWTQQQKLLAPDGAANDAFGLAVAISGETVVAGAHLDRIAGNDVGSAYVFVRAATAWTQQQKLPGLGGLTDFFGYSVSIAGDTLIVGAPLADAAGGSIADAGAAAVYVRSGTTWTLQRTLYASDPVASDDFGWSVSVSGNTAVVGSILDDTPGFETGSAYVFLRTGTIWTEQQKLVASDGGNGDGFGGSVSVLGDTVVIGAGSDDTAAGVNAGSAYVFVRSGTTWTQQQKLLAPDGVALDGFGGSVSLSADTIVAGAPGDDSLQNGADSGSAHVFRVPPTADVAITMTDSPDPVLPGANLVYTIMVTNGGPGAALGVQVTLPTPTGLTFLSNGGACTSPFPCALGTLAAAQTETITATYGVPPGYVGPNPIVGTAIVTTTTVDPVPANNQATAMTAVAPANADLAIVKLGPATVAAGSSIVYSITVTNSGPSDAGGVQVADPTPPGLTFVSNAGSCTTPFPCALATVPAGQNRVITATFNVPAAYGGPNPIVNQATVTATTSDPNASNNAAVATTTVTFIANLEPAAIGVDVAGNSVFQPNETVTVAPSWRNAGAAAVASVTGAASSFTGPAGPTYTIADAVASYATIAAGATASCGADCYRVTIAAATRPATHWDTTFLETITPGAFTKTWRLHIGDSFTDVPPTNGFYRFVEAILHKNVTGGCTPTAYCPTASTTRDQMAVFVLVSKEPSGFTPPPCGATPMFADVPASSGFCPWVEELARRGVVGGCGGGNYCPSSPATREQMAVFVLRTLDAALNPPACGTPVFADVPASSPFCKWIEELARRGVVSGCGSGNYCPTATVTREQMGVFLTLTFGLTLYGL